MSDSAFYVGSKITVTALYTDTRTQEPVDPDESVIRWRTPDRLLHTDTPTRLRPGEYEYDLLLDHAGSWVIGYGTGVSDRRPAASEITITVKTGL